MIREFKSYYWSNNDTPIKSDDHCLDELRYYIMSRPDVPKMEERKTAVQLNKEKLIRRLRRNVTAR